MSSSWGRHIRLTLFGESHGACVGMVLDGLRAGLSVSAEDVARYMARRAPGHAPLVSARREADVPRFLSGLKDGHTNGAPLCVLIDNLDARGAEYDALKELARPSHADYVAHVKHHGFEDRRGGGHFSGRLTAPLVCAAAIVLPALNALGIRVTSRLLSIGGETSPEGMLKAVQAALDAGDSVGGVAEAAAEGLPIGLGEPFFDGLESTAAHLLFSIPAVKGVEFGDGFALSAMRGSQANDPYRAANPGVEPSTNHQGGLTGGLTNGMPLVARAAFKPTPTIAREQSMARLDGSGVVTQAVSGRHDPCVAVRGVVCVEAALILALADVLAGEGRI